MKVNLQTTKIGQTKKTQTIGKTSNLSNTTTPQINELSNNSTLGRSIISFTGDKIDVDAIRKTKDDLIAKRYAAQSEIDKADKWNYWDEKAKAENAAEEEIKAKGISKIHWKKRRIIRDNHMNPFYDKNTEIQEIVKRKSDLQSIVDTCNAALEDSDSRITLGENFNSLLTAQDAVNNMLRAKGGLRERIAGYGAERSKIERIFVQPLAASKDNPNVTVPPSILLHGATGTGKTTFLDAIAEQSEGVVIDKLEFDKKDEDPDLRKTFNLILAAARERYLEKDENKNPKKIRTILLINEAEEFFAMTPEYAKSRLDYKLDEDDYKYLTEYGKKTNLTANVGFLKGFLDHCAQAPKDDDDKERGGLTVFITTNYPHLIHPDLLTRNGKMPYIAINPAEASNIEAVVKHYSKLNSEALESAKNIRNIDDIDNLVGITNEAKKTLKEYKREGKLNELIINYEAIPYDKIALRNNPTAKLGAYSNDTYRKISEETFQKYLENPEIPYYTHLNKTFMITKRDIGPKRFEKFNAVDKMLAPLEIGEREELIDLEKMDALDEKYKARLDYVRLLEESEKENLLDKKQSGEITEDEIERLKEIEQYQKLDKMTLEEYVVATNGESDSED